MTVAFDGASRLVFVVELNAGLGFLPLNAFYKGFAVEGSVTYHFSTTWGWEIAEGGYVFAKTSTGLQQQLLNNFGVQPTQLPNAEFLGSDDDRRSGALPPCHARHAARRCGRRLSQALPCGDRCCGGELVGFG